MLDGVPDQRWVPLGALIPYGGWAALEASDTEVPSGDHLGAGDIASVRQVAYLADRASR